MMDSAATVLPLRIGTRGSPLALAQARETRARLIAADPGLEAAGAIEVEVIRTTADRITDRPLADIGGKGLFTKEIEEALLDRRIDLAVHSMKDVPTWLPEGLVIAAYLPREDPRDALFARHEGGLAELPRNAVVGTASLRRAAQIRALRPDVSVISFRGNVETRLRKLAEGVADATLLAVAGLRRLELAVKPSAVLEPEELLPAVGQGAIGLECRADDESLLARLRPLNDVETAARVTAERAMLDVLDGSCHTPIGGLAECRVAGTLRLRGLIAKPDGSLVHRAQRQGDMGDAEAIGREVGAVLREAAGPGFLTGAE
jgi:hydroxymethylbilane synthase